MSDAASPLAGPLPHRFADEVALLLAAEGIATTRVDSSAGIFLVVAGRDRARAARILAEEYPDGFAEAAAEHAGARGGGTRDVRARGRGGSDDAAAYAAPALADAAALQDRWFGRGSWIVIALTGGCCSRSARRGRRTSAPASGGAS